MGKLTKAVIYVFILQIASKVLGLLKESLLAYKFGTSFIVDAYTIAITFPSIIFAIFAGGIAEAYIPMMASIEGKQSGLKFTYNTMTILTCASLIVSFLCILLNAPIVDLLAPGFDTESLKLTQKLVLIISFIFPIMIAYNIIIAYTTFREHFITANFINLIIVNIIVIASILVASKAHPEVLSIGYVISQFIPLVCIWIIARKKLEFNFTFIFNLRDKNFKKLLTLAIPLGASLLVNQLNSMIDRIIASLLGEGVIAALGYANKIQLLFYSLTTSIIMSVCFPRINSHFVKHEYDQGMNYVRNGFMIATFIGIPIAATLFIFAEPITGLFFERGMFTAQSTEITAQCLAFYSIGIPFYSYREILLKALSARKRQDLILKNTTIAISANVILNLLLFRVLEHIGLALATSLSGVIATFLMYMDIKKVGLKLFHIEMWYDIIKIIICTIIMGAIGIILGLCLQQSLVNMKILTVVIVLIMACSYLLLSYFSKVQILRWILGAVLPKK